MSSFFKLPVFVLILILLLLIEAEDKLLNLVLDGLEGALGVPLVRDHPSDLSGDLEEHGVLRLDGRPVVEVGVED